jgi:hypothetical protein
VILGEDKAGSLERGMRRLRPGGWFPPGPFLAFSLSTLFAFLVGWNADIEDPGVAGDSDIEAGLYMAAHGGLRFGKDVAIQYGPLGFLKFPASYDIGLASLSVVYVVTVGLLTAGLAVWAAHTWSGRWATAAVMAAIAMSLLADQRIWQLGASAPVYVLAVVACAHVIRGDAPPWLVNALAIGGGALVGIEVLGKVNYGVLISVMVVFTLVVVPDRLRHLTGFGLTFLVTSASAWFLTGQSLSNVDDYVRTSIEIMRGRSPSTMTQVLVLVAASIAVTGGWLAIRRLGDHERLSLVGLTAFVPLGIYKSSFALTATHLLALAAAAIAIAASWLTTRDLPTGRRLSLVALIAFFLLMIFKSSSPFERERAFIFFSSAVGLWFAFRWTAGRLLPLAVFGLLVAIYFAAAVVNPGRHSSKTVAVGVNPLNNRPTSLFDTESPEAGRARLRRSYRVSVRALKLIGNRPVDVLPGRASVAWAYRLNWRPLPVFDYNMIGTRALARLNPASLEQPGGPSRILREGGPDMPQHQPATTAALLCHFRQLYADSRWEVLARGRNRCERRPTSGTGDGSR